MWRFRLITLLFLTIRIFAQDYIMFPHQFHIEDMEMACEDCHGTVAEVDNMAKRLLPEKDDCVSCHDGDTATEECEACHADPEDPLSFAESQPLSGLEFSHQYHLSNALTCSGCHSEITNDDGSEPAHIWTAADCQSCHGSTKPVYHTMEWSWLHGSEVTHATQSSCNTCHAQASCDACHQVQEVEPKVHPAGFILSHGFEAYAGLADCAVCHSRNDCQGCHDQNLIMPMDHNFPDWANQSGGLHTENAMDNPDICLVCHEPAVDLTCTRCHTN